MGVLDHGRHRALLANRLFSYDNGPDTTTISVDHDGGADFQAMLDGNNLVV